MKVKAQGNICWNCGGPGEHDVGTRLKCSKCDVAWFPDPVKTAKLNKKIVYRSWVLDAVDFTKPGALSSPA